MKFGEHEQNGAHFQCIDQGFMLHKKMRNSNNEKHFVRKFFLSEVNENEVRQDSLIFVLNKLLKNAKFFFLKKNQFLTKDLSIN